MPRSSRRSAPAARSAPRTQTRSASTAQPRHAPQQSAPPPPTSMTSAPPAAMGRPQPQQPGLFGQMASTAAGVAVGSAVGHSIGHGVSGMFGGRDNYEEPEATPQTSTPQYDTASYQATNSHSCDADLKAFTNCLDANNNDLSACQFYLDMLKQCQAFAANRV
ncbi:hypothetical protein K7432_002355 [Basidiobolus ranarum]|uniref:CHCH domain-containing protein n=1 Tax=Basidiobolus ranarum TaxID=34480 RepID=A0ABR2X1Q5_9FUNG